MIYLLDTDMVIYLVKGRAEVASRIKQAGEENVYISPITVGELFFGVYKSQRKEENLRRYTAVMAQYNILPFTNAVGQHYGQIRADLEKVGTPIGDNDLWIAAFARAYRATLVTNNVDEFKRVKDLTIENWLRITAP